MDYKALPPLALAVVMLVVASPLAAQQPNWFALHLPGPATAITMSSAGYFVLNFMGIYRMGASDREWKSCNRGITEMIITLASDTQGTLYASTVGGVYYSSDRGDRWHHTLEISQTLKVLPLTITPSGIAFAGTGTGSIYYSYRGVGWTEAQRKPADTGIQTIGLLTTGELIVGTANGRVSISPDWGTTWREVLSLGEGMTITAMTIPPTDEIYVAALNTRTSSSEVYRSGDRGVTWDQRNSGLPHGDISALAENKLGQIYAAFRTGGIFASTNGGRQWYDVSSGLIGLPVLTLVSTPGHQLSAGTSAGPYITLYSDLPAGVPAGARTSVADARSPIVAPSSIEIEIRRPGYTELVLFNALGERITTLFGADMEPGRHAVPYDAAALPNGIYLYRLRNAEEITSGKLMMAR